VNVGSENELVLRFKNNRKSAKNHGKGLMYLGYILMFLDGLSIVSAIFNIISYLRYGDHTDPFLVNTPKGTIFFGWFFDTLRKSCEFC